MRRRSWTAVFVVAALLALAAWWLRSPVEGEPAAPNDSFEPSATKPATPDSLTFEARSLANEPRELAPELGSPAAPSTEPIAAAKPTSHLLYGVVHPPEGDSAHLEPPHLSVVDRLGHRTGVDCAEDGSYSVGGLQPQPYWLSASVHNGGEIRAYVELDPSAESTRVDLRLERRREMLVRVVDRDGKPIINGATLAVATRERPGEWIDDPHASGNNMVGVGWFRHRGQLKPEPPGEVLGKLNVHVATPVWVSLLNGQRVLESKLVDATPAEVTFVLDADSALLAPASIRGRFVDAETLEPARVKSVMLGTKSAVRTSPVDESGLFEFKLCRPGWVTLSVFAAGYEKRDLRTRLEPATAHDVGDVLLQSSIAMEGVVLDACGNGVRVAIAYESLDPSTWRVVPDEPNYSTKSDSDGRFRINGLSRWPYRLTVRSTDGGWGHASRIVDLRHGPVSDVELRVEKGVPLVVRPSIDEWINVRFAVRDATGLELLSSRLSGPEPRAVLLAPGRYELECRVEGQAPSTRTIEIGAEPVLVTLP